MEVLVTGAHGFVGRNLVARLQSLNIADVLSCTRETSRKDLEEYCRRSSFVFHLAGVNRPAEEADFMSINSGFTKGLLETLQRLNPKCPVMLSSSSQAGNGTPYGQSKLAAEELLKEHSRNTGAATLVYRYPNLFGKWSRPDYNSAVATFCHRISRDLEVQISDPARVLTLLYIDDLVDDLVDKLRSGGVTGHQILELPVTFQRSLGEIVELLRGFRANRENHFLPDVSDPFVKRLYSCYLSFLPKESFSYPLKMHSDHRGSFSEFIKTGSLGQVSVNVARKGITKGNHWHDTKVEKFLVVSGSALVQFRDLHRNEIIEIEVSSEKLEVVDIPPGYTHNIRNTGEGDLVFVIWANETLDPKRPDTYFLNVVEGA